MSSEHESIQSVRIVEVISAVAARIHYAESRRATYSAMGGVLIAAALTIATFSWSSIQDAVLGMATLFAALAMFVVGGSTIWLYGQQTNRYPFTSATKTWKWFYRDALSDVKKFSLTWKDYFACAWSSTERRVHSEYLSQFGEFKEQCHKLKALSVNTEQDVEQLYVLHVNELYKNLHLTHLRTLFNRGILGIVVAALLGAACGYVLDRIYSEPQTFIHVTEGFRTSSDVRRISSAFSKHPLFTAEIEIENTGTVPLDLDRIAIFDSVGFIVPFELQYPEPRFDILPPGVCAKYKFAFQISSVGAGRISDVSILVN
jgi:hypothetical protein